MNFRINASPSVSVRELSQQILQQYDANGNGQIDLNRPVLTNRGHSEAYRQDATFSENAGIAFPHRELTRKELFEAADHAGDNNGEVTGAELENLIGSFDGDHNGVLDSRGIQGMRKGRALGELDLFNRKYDEERSDHGI